MAALLERLDDDLDTVGDALTFFVHRRDDLLVLADDHVDDVNHGRLVNSEADGIDGFGG